MNSNKQQWINEMYYTRVLYRGSYLHFAAVSDK